MYYKTYEVVSLYQKEERADVLPANSPKYPWFMPQHFFDVTSEIICTVDPAHSSCFDENYE